MRRIEDHALIGDTHTAALVARDGVIDWLCMPRFDSESCFGALVGDERHGFWRIAPRGGVRRVERRYRGDTLILETDFVTDDGTARLIDFMPIREDCPRVVRIVHGLRGSVEIELELVARFDYGQTIPWTRARDGVVTMLAGADSLHLHTPIDAKQSDQRCTARFRVGEGDDVPFVLSWASSYGDPPDSIDAGRALEVTERWWREWSDRCGVQDRRDDVMRSMITIKALTYSPSGGMVASPTTSLPEWPGGASNWDYRYCWIRDATFTFYALLNGGYQAEATQWRDWLLRALGGDPSNVSVLFDVEGARLGHEEELGWLPGYLDSRPVRVGNAARRQRQLDIFGELVDALFTTRTEELHAEPHDWDVERCVVEHLESLWREPDQGIWESRDEPRHYTHSKMMCWVAFDRAVRGVEELGLDGPVDHWRAMRDEIHEEVCTKAWDADRGAFTEYYGSRSLDVSVLRMPLVGFLPGDDERVRSTIRAVRAELEHDGLLYRYSGIGKDRAAEGAFLPATFWLVDALVLSGELDEAEALYNRVRLLANDVGLLSEEYDPVARQMLGNFPQSLTHVSLVNSAANLTGAADGGPALQRSQR